MDEQEILRLHFQVVEWCTVLYSHCVVLLSGFYFPLSFEFFYYRMLNSVSDYKQNLNTKSLVFTKININITLSKQFVCLQKLL